MTAPNLDPLRVGQGGVKALLAALGHAVDVDDHRIVVGEHGRIEPPEADRAAMMSGGDARHVGDFPDHIYHVADAFLFEFGLANDRDALGDLLQVFLHLVGRDRYVPQAYGIFLPAAVRRPGRSGQCQKNHRCPRRAPKHGFSSFRHEFPPFWYV